MTSIGKEPSSRKQRLHAAKDYGVLAWLPPSLQLQGLPFSQIPASHGAAGLVALESSPTEFRGWISGFVSGTPHRLKGRYARNHVVRILCRGGDDIVVTTPLAEASGFSGDGDWCRLYTCWPRPGQESTTATLDLHAEILSHLVSPSTTRALWRIITMRLATFADLEDFTGQRISLPEPPIFGFQGANGEYSRKEAAIPLPPEGGSPRAA